MGRTILYIVVALLVIIGGAGIYVYSAFGDLVRTAVADHGPRATGSDVTLGTVNVSLLSGEARIGQLVVGNPKGFETDSAIVLDDVFVKLDPMSVLSDTVAIQEIDIRGPMITYELSGAGSNIAALQKNVERFAAGAGGGSGPRASDPDRPAPKDGAAKPERKITIDRLTVSDAKVRLSATMLKGQAATVPLPGFTLTDIGKESGGATPAEVMEQVLARLNTLAARAISDAGIGKLGGEAGEAGEKIKREAERALDDAGKTLKGLFGK